jgi:glycosyltransferase involved in cell wall biosynthesis
MRVLHLSTVDFWGQGISAYRLHKALQNKGIDSTMITLVKSSGDPSVKMIIFDPIDKTKFHVFDKVIPDTDTISNYMIEKWSNLLKMQIMPSEGEIIFSLTDSVVNLEKIIEVNQADIIHIHWSPGLIDIEKAPLYFMDKPVCLTIYDMYPFTGGCHNEKCEKFKEECINCYLLKDEVKEIASINFNIKKDSYNLLNLYVVASNNCLKRKAEESGIFGLDTEIKVIPPSVPLEKFSKENKKRVREHLQLPLDKHILIFCCSSLKNRRNDLERLIEALTFLKKENLDFYLILLGAYPEEIKRNLSFPVHAVGFVPYEEIMCWYYSASDIFINPSTQTGIPVSVLEAMSCGIPVVGFDYGGIKDVIEHKKNGYLAKTYDIEDFASGIKWILEDEERKKYMSLNSRKRIKYVFNLENVATEYIKLYENMLEFKNITKKDKFLKWGEKLFVNKQIDTSLSVFSKMLEKYGEDPEILNNIGVIYWEMGMRNKAFKFFKRAYELNPSLKEIRENYKKVIEFRRKN